MSISFGSINTGLPKDIVKQIIAADKIPLEKMQVRKEKLQSKKNLVQELTKLVEKIRMELSANRSRNGFRELKAFYNDELIDVVLDKSVAEPGSYQFEVGRMAQKSSAMSAGYDSKDDSYLGVGYISYSLPDGTEKDIYIDEENSSLEGIARLINQNPDAGMRATVVNDGSGTDEPWRLIISLSETGDSKLADFPYFYFVDPTADLYLDQQRDAHDAKVKIDGFDIEVESNKSSQLIPGATVTIKKARPGEEFTINITEDSEKVADKFEALVESINAVLKFIIDQNTMDKDTDTSGTLGGDITLQTIESRLRNLVFLTIPTETGDLRLGDFGVNFQKSGLLKLDKKKFQAVVDKNYKKVDQFMVGWFTPEKQRIDGMFDNLAKVVDGVLTKPWGILASSENGLSTKMGQIDRQVENKQRMIDQKERMLKDKFARLEGTISKIKSQGAGLSALQTSNPDSFVTQLGQ